MRHPKDIGDRSTLPILLALQDSGWATYLPFGELGRVYLVPIADVRVTSEAALRVAPPRNGQHRQIRWASNYEIARVDVY